MNSELRKEVNEYQHADKYQFCQGCKEKQNTVKDGRVIRVSCPVKFNPFSEQCPKHKRFMDLEKDKNRRYDGRQG
jgi:hypothetical protein